MQIKFLYFCLLVILRAKRESTLTLCIIDILYNDKLKLLCSKQIPKQGISLKHCRANIHSLHNCCIITAAHASIVKFRSSAKCIITSPRYIVVHDCYKMFYCVDEIAKRVFFFKYIKFIDYRKHFTT